MKTGLCTIASAIQKRRSNLVKLVTRILMVLVE